MPVPPTRSYETETGRRPRVEADGMAAATFRHLTSRNLDPQLHTHAVVANMTRGQDGEWRSAEFTSVERSKMLIGAYTMRRSFGATAGGTPAASSCRMRRRSPLWSTFSIFMLHSYPGRVYSVKRHLHPMPRRRRPVEVPVPGGRRMRRETDLGGPTYAAVRSGRSPGSINSSMRSATFCAGSRSCSTVQSAA